MIGPADAARLIACLSRVAPHYLPLLRAAEAGLIALLLLERDSPASVLREVAARRRPLVMLIGDDDHRSTGPAGWRCAGRLRWCADFATVNGAAGDPAHYAAATLDALGGCRVALVETDSAHAMEWFAWFDGRCPVTTIQPAAGLCHPVPPSPAEVH